MIKLQRVRTFAFNLIRNYYKKHIYFILKYRIFVIEKSCHSDEWFLYYIQHVV